MTVEVIALWQADCDRCGWHTRQADSKSWVEQLAAWHRNACPNPEPPPTPRNGARMECGDWWWADPGSAAGATRAFCPIHGDRLMVEANVPEPETFFNKPDKFWTLTSA
jgi:hypothetical protein